MRHAMTKYLPNFAVAVLTMSAAMASSAWAGDEGPSACNTPSCALHSEGKGGDGQPMGEIIRQNTGTLMDQSGIDRGNSHNGYSTAGTGDRDENGVAHVDYKDVAKKPARVDYKDLNISPSQVILNALSAADDAAIASAASHTWTWSGAPDVNLGTGNYRVTGSDFKFNENGTLDFTRTIGGDPSTATHVHYDPHNRTAVTRGGPAASPTVKEGHGSLTIVKRDGTIQTSTPTEAHVTGPSGTSGKPGTGAANRAKLKADPVALAAAQAAARAAAAAPSAPHTPQPKPANTPTSPSKVSMSAASVAQSKTPPVTQAPRPKL